MRIVLNKPLNTKLGLIKINALDSYMRNVCPPPPAPKPSDSLDLSLALQAGRMASTIMPQEAANTRYITLSLSIATKFT